MIKQLQRGRTSLERFQFIVGSNNIKNQSRETTFDFFFRFFLPDIIMIFDCKKG